MLNEVGRRYGHQSLDADFAYVIGWHDLDFDLIPVMRHSSRGTPFIK